MVRNCPRCTSDFEAAEGQWVCLDCRLTRAYSKPLLGADLTPRERSVVAQLGMCKSNKEIAEALHLEPSTVKVYMSKIFIKLGRSSRLQVAMYANSSEFTSGNDTIAE
jgi:DNA-binding NarL/FixJ family response regulator